MQILAEAEELPQATNIKTQLVALWISAASALILLIAFIAFPGFWPPMSPQLTADQVASFYRNHTAWIRFSMVTFNLCGIMLLPFFCVIVVQMKRMATQSQAFAYCYLSAVVSGATLFALADIFYAVAVFRPERDPDLIMLLNDLGWMVFIAPVGMIVAQNLMLALAVYHDNAAQPGVSALGRPSVVADPVRDGPLGVCGRDNQRATGLGRCSVVLAAQRRLRHLHCRHVLRCPRGHSPAGI